MGLTPTPAPPTARPVDAQQPPQKGSAASLLRAFLDRKAPYDHALHIRRHAAWRKADLYNQSLQWLRPSFNVDPTRTPHWSQIEYDEDDPDAIPMPVYNEMAGLLRNESARLGRPEYKPVVRPKGAKPDAKTREGARRATEILDAAKTDMGWDERAEMGYHHMALYGGWILKSWWDVDMKDTVRLPVDGGMKCPECKFKLSNANLTPDLAGAAYGQQPDAPNRMDSVELQNDKGDPFVRHTVTHCLTCDTHTEQQMAPAMDPTGQPLAGPDGALIQIPMTVSGVPGPPKLQPFTAAGDELHQQDHFGRDLGEDVPLGKWMCRTCSPYDVFWENLGIDVQMDGDPQGWQEVLEVHVESLDWIRRHFPKVADQVKPEGPEALLKWHPIAGERALFFSSAVGAQLFRNHCRVKEYHKKPFMEPGGNGAFWTMNRGRSIMMAGNVTLLDGDFLVESKNTPGALIPRVHYDYAPWELRSGGRELHGVSLSELLFDAQDNVNEAKSQTADARQRMSSPKWLIDRRLNMDYEECGGSGSHWLYDGVDGQPGIKPEPVGSTTIAGGVASEIEADIDYMGRVAGRAEVEQGSVPSGVSAAAAIQILAEQTAEGRRPKIRRIRKMLERVWGHGLTLMHEFVREERTYKVKNEANEWCERSWTGLDILGQTDVMIEPEPEADNSIQKQERIRDGITLGVIAPASNPKMAMVIAKELEIPSDLYDEQNQQYEAAEREFIDFLDMGRPPVIDSDLDDHASHYDQHGIDCHGEKWRDLEQQAGWDQALLAIWGWEQAFPMLVQQFGAQWPQATELQIFQAWNFMLTQSGFLNRLPPPQRNSLSVVMRFRAHMAAHKMMLEGNQAQAQQGAQIAAAPAAPATQAGTMPTAQQPQAVQ